ncbi:uncharacterized protein LOC112557101 isoform X2 [Pomacea canaliculata]|uniref:uncharacterized protein LOC112557101 isoform X2 n=1 Tax=Pomacea canaliculata TaxID=400727 RepID=UPI000D73D493|nr:uncharacterized protein LOC112557101 isoform X2 [Pomacea canaliculata]
MRSPQDFLALNRTYQYQGTRNIRGIDCDAWSMFRFDYPDPTSQKNPASVWTWYFANSDWMSAMGYRSNLVLPVMLEIFSEDSFHYMVQIYDYSAEEPDFGEYDVSSCYDPATSKNVAFLVQGSFYSVVGTSLKTFKSYVRQSLQRVMGVSPLRISRLDVQEAGLNVLITFDLLDKAPLAGDVANPPVEKDVTTAYNVLMNALNTSTMVITWDQTSVASLASQRALNTSSMCPPGLGKMMALPLPPL